ncbi:MAG: hydantoinase/oxoprolinase family protein [Chloroflexi bacterium]|nr:hydantoinase/oxoprolinase family protein [Chloroflexota bacterium]
MSLGYELCFDVGGTFTDITLLDETTGDVAVAKVLTTPEEPAIGVSAGIQELMAQIGIRGEAISRPVRGATTLITNCLIERKGKKTALITTRGFRDLIEIGREWRYDIYDLFLKMPPPLVPRYLRKGITERMDKTGKVIQELDIDGLRGTLADLKREDVESLAICFLHSYVNPAHEGKARAVAKEIMPEVEVSISSEVVPEIGEYERSSTVVANAYVLHIARAHFAALDEVLEDVGITRGLYLMHSGGGVVTADAARRFPVRLVESGPAAGAMAGVFYGKLTGIRNLVTFDMGGTTAKIALISDGVASVVNRFEVARVARFKKGSGLPLKIQVINMVEIGAGGGSIASVDDMGLVQVGPHSAGAVPGPACYGRGGDQPTVTDADLVLGYLNPSYFLGGKMPLSKDLAESAIRNGIAEPMSLSILEAAAAVNLMVNEHMANAARVHLAEEGKDYRQYTLLAFGGAGPVHAVEVARRVGIRRVLCPLSAGVLSAVGLMATPVAIDCVRSFVSPLDKMDWAAFKALDREMEEEAVNLIAPAGLSRDEIEFSRTADMHYRGQGYEVNVPIPFDFLEKEDAERFEQAFYDRYFELYRRRAMMTMPVELVNWRLTVRGKTTPLKARNYEEASDGPDRALKGKRPAYYHSLQGFLDVLVYDHYHLRPGMAIQGPAIVEQRESTSVIGPGDRITVDPYLNLFVQLRQG